MNRIFFSRKLSIKDHLKIFKTLFIFINATAFLLYLFLRLLFISTPITMSDDIIALLKTLGIGSLTAIVLSTMIVIVEIIDHLITQRNALLKPAWKWTRATLLTILVIYMAGCKTQLTGIHKDLNTGVVTSYENIEPANTLLVMNNEVLNHTDIPLGENFVLINDGIKGLVEKDGKVSAGCHLVITDKAGKNILNEPDLFKGGDRFQKENAKSLKCTISTGKPMSQDENYDVAVTFWDKFGDGKIENKFSIKIIDMP